MDLIRQRRSDKGEHAMDVFMDALRKQRVQAHIAGELQRELARAKAKRGNLFLIHINGGKDRQE